MALTQEWIQVAEDGAEWIPVGTVIEWKSLDEIYAVQGQVFIADNQVFNFQALKRRDT
jgi:hypothetical protein